MWHRTVCGHLPQENPKGPECRLSTNVSAYVACTYIAHKQQGGTQSAECAATNPHDIHTYCRYVGIHHCLSVSVSLVLHDYHA